MIKTTGTIHGSFKPIVAVALARGGRHGDRPVRHSSMGETAAFFHGLASARDEEAGSSIFCQDITLIALCSSDRLFELGTQKRTLRSVLVDKNRSKQFSPKNRIPAREE